MNVTLAVDAMGGDKAPEMVVEGVSIAAKRYPNVHFLLFGDECQLKALICDYLKNRTTIVHCDEFISPHMKPILAIRSMPKSSMRLAIKSVSEGKAQGVISAGNTGAYLALAKMILKTLPGIDRPALASLIPTLRSESVMLDLGANLECTAQNLAQFAIMGEMFARRVLSLPNPTVGLLNVGSEDVKGSQQVKDGASLIRESNIRENFKGFIEGDDIPRGTVDVVVTDGFTGNAVLKAGEGVLQLALSYFKQAFKSSWMAKCGYLLARPMIKKLSYRLDYRRYNGGIWLGLNGVAIKSHGGTDALGFAHAVDIAVDMITSCMNEHLIKEFTQQISLTAEVSSAKAVNS